MAWFASIRQSLKGGLGLDTSFKILAFKTHLPQVSRGLSRVEAGHPGVPRLVQVTSGGFSWWL